MARDLVIAAGITSYDAERAAELEEQRYIEPEITPGMSAYRRKQLVTRAASNRTLPACRTLWKAIQTMLDDPSIDASGNIDVATDNEDGRVVLTGIPSRPNEHWPIPTLLISATFREALVRRVFPRAVFTAKIWLEAPHQHVLVARRRSYTKSALLESATRMRELHAIVQRIATWFSDGQILLVLQKDVEEILIGEEKMANDRTLPPLRRNVLTAHYGDLEGIDLYRDTRCILAVGCPRESVPVVERLARRLTGVAGIRLGGNFLSVIDTEECADGVWRAVADLRHPDATSDAVRASIMVDSATQAIGRGRGVNRDGDNPLTIVKLGDRPGDAPVSALLTEEFEYPSPQDLMLATAGIAVTNAKHAAALFPELWPSPDAARQAFSQERSVRDPHKNSYRESSHSSPEEAAPDVTEKLWRAEYQLAGAGNKVCDVIWDPERIDGPGIHPTPRAWLEGRLGPLAFLLVTYRPPQPEPLMWGKITVADFEERMRTVTARIMSGTVRPIGPLPPCAAIWNSTAIDAAMAEAA